tara:strand:- start:643 stop:942 length:300 start_codon:yes stop_codon:yes gene_type:complete
MKKLNLILFLLIFFAFLGCKTVGTKVDKTVTKEEEKLTKFLNKTSEELKIEFGEPDFIQENKGNRTFIYLKSRLKIKCERRFEVNPKNIVIGFSSKNCF